MTVIDLSNVTIKMSDELCQFAVGAFAGQYLMVKELGVIILLTLGIYVIGNLILGYCRKKGWIN